MLAVLSMVKVVLLVLVLVLRRSGIVRGDILEYAICLVLFKCQSLNHSPGYPLIYYLEILDADI